MLSSISHGWFLGLKPSTQCVTADLLQMLPTLFRLEYSWKSWKPFHLFHLLAAYFGKPFTFYLSKSMWEYAQQQRQKVVGYRRLQISWLLIYHPPPTQKKPCLESFLTEIQEEEGRGKWSPVFWMMYGRVLWTAALLKQGNREVCSMKDAVTASFMDVLLPECSNTSSCIETQQ